MSALMLAAGGATPPSGQSPFLRCLMETFEIDEDCARGIAGTAFEHIHKFEGRCDFMVWSAMMCYRIAQSCVWPRKPNRGMTAFCRELC